MKTVENAASSWRWFSVQALAALAVLPVVWVQLPEDVKAWLPDGAKPWILALIAVGGIVGRLVDQGQSE